MSKSYSIASYQDVMAVLDTAMRYDTWPAMFTCESNAKAHRWRHRANCLRTALRRKEEADHKLPAGTGTCIYDHLAFRLPKGAAFVVIEPHATVGQLEIDGEIIDPVSDAQLDMAEEVDLNSDDIF